MTDQRQLDRLLGAFFVTGTDELADRVIDAALDQIGHTEQRRTVRTRWRFPTMTLSFRFAAAAVIAVLAVGTALYLTRPAPSAVGTPSPTPGVSAGPSAPASLGDLVEESVAGVTLLRPAAWRVVRQTEARPGPVTYASSIPMTEECLARGILMARSCLPGGRLPSDGVLLTAGAYGKAVFPQASGSPTLRSVPQPECQALGGSAYEVEVRGVLIWGCVGGPAGEASLRSVVASIR